MYTQESLHSAAATSTRDSSHRDDVLLNGFGRPDTLGAHKLGIFYCWFVLICSLNGMQYAKGQQLSNIMQHW